MNRREKQALEAFFSTMGRDCSPDEFFQLCSLLPRAKRPREGTSAAADERAALNAIMSAGGAIAHATVSQALRDLADDGTTRELLDLLLCAIEPDSPADEDAWRVSQVAIPVWLLERIAWALRDLDTDASELYRFVLERHGFAAAANLVQAVRE